MALDAYSEHLIPTNGDKSRADRMRRLRQFFEPVLDTQISRLQPERADELYVELRKSLAVDSHRNILGNAKGFLRWCKKQRWISSNPLEDVEGVGTRKTGKEQLTGDEAQRFFGWTMWKAWRRGDGHERRDSDAAIGAMMLLLMGLRSSDVTRRVVRDVDLGCTVLHVKRGKTKKSNRARKIPKVLQPILRLVIADRDPFAPLFEGLQGKHHTKAWLHAAVRRFCRDADVPVVCPHGLKGTSGSVLADTGELADRIADHLSHEHHSTTERHYVRPGALEDARTERGLQVITGDRFVGESLDKTELKPKAKKTGRKAG